MLTVILPAYNEAHSVEKNIPKVVDVLAKIGLEYEIILVDDGSRDGTFQKASATAARYANVRVLGYQPNMGKGYALKYGAQAAKGDLVLFIDADMDLPPSQIPTFLNYLKDRQADVVIGSKKHPLSKLAYPTNRRFLSGGYCLLLRLMFNLNVTDTQVGLKLFRKEVLHQVLSQVKTNRFAFDLDLLVQISRANYKIVEAPVEIDFHFRSRVNNKQIWCMFVDTLQIFYRTRLQLPYKNTTPALSSSPLMAEELKVREADDVD